MTVSGVLTRTVLLIMLLVTAAVLPLAGVAMTGNRALGEAALWVGVITFGIALTALCSWREAGRVFAPIGAFAEGLTIGGLVLLMEPRHPGIAPPMFALSVTTLLATLITWVMKLSPLARGIRSILTSLALSMVLFVAALGAIRFISHTISIAPAPGPLPLTVLSFVLLAGTITLTRDLAFIRTGVASSRPQHLEWSAAFGLVLGVFWLYVGGVRGLRIGR